MPFFTYHVSTSWNPSKKTAHCARDYVLHKLSFILEFLNRILTRLSEILGLYLDDGEIACGLVLPRNASRLHDAEQALSPFMLPPPMLPLEDLEALELPQRIFRMPGEFPESEEAERSGRGVGMRLIEC